jgi:hypothetical protein
VGFGQWIRGLFSSIGPDDEAAEREEYNLPDPGEVDLEGSKRSAFASAEGTEAAEADLDEFKAPPDPAP